MTRRGTSSDFENGDDVVRPVGSAVTRLDEAMRWPDGFVCPACGHDEGCRLAHRRLMQCAACRAQTSTTAGTIFHSTKLPLVTWLRGIRHLTASKNGISGFTLAEVAAFAKAKLAPSCEVISDGLSCFPGVTEAGCSHTYIVCGGGRAAVERPAFKWVNTTLGNIKSALSGTYRHVAPKHAPRYLAEFQYRCDRRNDLAGMLERLTSVRLRTAPFPYRPVKLAESHA